ALSRCMESRMILGSGMARNLFSQSRSVWDVAEVKPKSVSSSKLAAERGIKAIRQISAVNRTRRMEGLLGVRTEIVYEAGARRTFTRYRQRNLPQIYADRRGSTSEYLEFGMSIQAPYTLE